MIRCDETWQLPAAQELAALLTLDDAVRAIVLKGSLVRGGTDRFSDVDLTVVVENAAMDRYAGPMGWLAPMGAVFAAQRFADDRGVTVRLCLEDFRRFDIAFLRRSALSDAERDQLFATGHRVLLDRLITIFAPVEQPVSPQNGEEEAVQRLCDAAWFKLILGVCKLGRGDHLIAAHLALEAAGDAIVLQMILRDRQSGTQIHRYGQRESVPLLEALRQSPGDHAQGILWLLHRAGEQLDRQAAQLLPDYRPHLPDFASWTRQMDLCQSP